MSDSDTFQTQVVGMAPHAVRAAELEVDVLRYIRRPNPRTLGLFEGIKSLRDAESRSAVTHIRIELSSSLKIAG